MEALFWQTGVKWGEGRVYEMDVGKQLVQYKAAHSGDISTSFMPYQESIMARCNINA